MRLIFMRHAECKGIKEGIINGWRDYPLTSVGRKEPIGVARDAQKLLGNLKIDMVYTSYLSRTHDTGKIFVETLGYKGKIKKDLRLNERLYGMFQGMKRIEAKKFPEYNTLSEKTLDLENKLIPEDDLRHYMTLNEYSEKLRVTINKLENIIPRSESILDLEKRLNEFIDEILIEENENKTIVIVTHANPLKLIAKRMQNLTYKKAGELRFATCALKIYDLRYNKEDGYEVLTEYNINKEMEG